jgi:hypothetical protein
MSSDLRGFIEEPVRWRLPVETTASSNSGGGTWLRTVAATRRSNTAARRVRHRTAAASFEHGSGSAGAMCGTPGGDSVLMSRPGAEREKLTGGTPWQILF